ncbi:MAG: DUF2384 domain-containing protein [Bacteroidetes bacterium]|jgi:putative toxin-antitoxin system antitoxin component (TIGR02293 family)|nr:DUF2384 domain-containing protein [Bacteroidota bacterium]
MITQYGEMMAEKNSNQKEYLSKKSKRNSNKVEEPFIAWDLSKAVANIQEGLASDILQTIQTRLDISRMELSTLLMISPRTLDRRRKEDVLPPDESERSYRIARLTDLAAEVFGSMEKASTWFKQPNYALGNKKPLDIVQTEPGARLVERTLQQIQHGITV